MIDPQIGYSTQPTPNPTRPVRLPELIRRETAGGLTVVRFFVNVMDADVDGTKMTDQITAARELLDRCFGKPFTAAADTIGESEDSSDASRILMERIRRVLDDEKSGGRADGSAIDDSDGHPYTGAANEALEA